MRENEKSIHRLMDLVQKNGAPALFTKEGLQYTKGALQQLKLAARCAASTVRIPSLRDRIPPHIREDILTQAYNMIEVQGRCSFVILLFEGGHADQNDDDLMKVFASMYTNMCEREESLRKLCKLTYDEYAEPGYIDQSKYPDKDF